MRRQQALRERTKTMKLKMKKGVRLKSRMSDIDSQKHQNGVFKCPGKPKVTIYGDLCSEGRAVTPASWDRKRRREQCKVVPPPSSGMMVDEFFWDQRNRSRREPAPLFLEGGGKV
ncbi:hypothetical protein TNCV_144771 [Trichonephila clavipes]|nr:hypothetical protein TNCV_144771 [Trichonephila clavipes]